MEKNIRHYLDKNFDRYMDILHQMVSTNSFTANQVGVNRLGKMTADAFKTLGFKADFIQSTDPEFGKHLVLTRDGFSNKKVGLISHLDTVFPPEEEVINHFFWRKEGDRIYGPGTNDIKGGTVMVLMVMETLQKFFPEEFDATTWIILLNAAEERWSIDFGELCRQHLGADALAALVFEAGYLENNHISLVAARKGMAIYDIRVEGKSAHAGNSHKNGANAILQMAEIVQKISALSNYDRDLTFNIGIISGGTVPNRVPHFAEARGEMRTFSHEIFKEAVSHLTDISNSPPVVSADGCFTCDIKINIIAENSPWPPNPETDNLFNLWEEIAKPLGFEIIREERGGLSDGNQLWDFVPTIDGLGPNGRNAHCSESSVDGIKDQEFVTLSSFVPKATLNTLAISKLISG